MKKTFYSFIRVLLHLYNWFYFRKVTVVGRENIPSDGAILFSPNHQNALLDPLLVGVTSGKSVYSLTRSDVFGGPLQWFFDAMQMLPIYRIRDGYGKLKLNSAIFEQCYNLLEKGHHMMMFSEGKHHDQYYLLPLSKGSSRLSLEAQMRAKKTKIYLQPVGLNYTSHRHARTRCVIVYGEAIDVSKYVSDYKQFPVLTLKKLKNTLQNNMADCLWLPNNDQSYLTQKKYINRHNTWQPFQSLKRQLKETPDQLKPRKKSTLLQKIGILLFSLPNLPAHLAINRLVVQFDDHVFHGSVKYLGGLMIFLLWWSIGLLGFASALGAIGALGYLTLSIGSLFIRQYVVCYDL